MKYRLSIALVPILLVACAASMGGGTRAVARLQPTTGNTASGSVNFVQDADIVKVSGEISGLKPNAEHGFHLHEKGDCSSGDGMSTGGHFNPDAKPYGNHGAAAHHAGDLPSLKADASGVARLSFDSKTISVGSGITNVIGRGLIVHRDPDGYTIQPTGNSGPRLACALVAAG